MVVKEKTISVRYLNKMKNFCVLPFMHSFVTHSNIGPCCAYTKNPKLNSYHQYWESEQLKKIKDNMLNDIRDNGCAICWKKEDRGFPSLRNHSNEIYKHLIQDIINGKKKDQPVVLDLRLGNLCNLKCRMCNSEWSSQIADEILSNPDLEWQDVPKEKITTLNYDAWEVLDKWIDKVDRVFMTGGEPTIIKKNIEYIEKIIKSERSKDVNLIFTTNATNINKEFLNIVDKFKSVHFAVSIDGVNDLANYIRYPSNWNQIKNNLHTIGQGNFGVGINTTIQWLNMTRLNEMFDFIESYLETGPKQFAGIWFQLVTDPIYLDPMYAPDFMKKKAVQDIKNFLNKSSIFHEDKYNTLLHGGLKENLESTVKFLEKSFGNEKYVDLFMSKMLQLDMLRGQKLFDILPELKSMEERWQTKANN